MITKTLLLYTTAAVFILVSVSIATAKKNHLFQGPLVGATTSDSTKIWLGVDSAQTVNLNVSKTKDFKQKRTITVSKFITGHIPIDQLKPDTKYFYQIGLSSNRESKKSAITLSQIYSFNTNPHKGTPAKLRFMFSSCSGAKAISEAASWSAINGVKNIQMMIQLGDNHYGDTTDPKTHDTHYIARRTSAPYIKATANCPTYSIWDDHDYGPNDSHGQTKGKELSLQSFKKYWANPSYGEANNPGCYYAFHYGDIHFIMLDSRYHRDPGHSKKSNDPTKTMLGKQQIEWLKQQLKSDSKFKIVGCGSEFQLKTTQDCFSGYKHEQSMLLDLFKQTKNIILITGDRHFVAGYQNRGETIEITSGPLGSKTYARRDTPDTFIRASKGKQFCIFEIDTTKVNPTADLEIYRVGKGLLHRLHFTNNQINGKSPVHKFK